VIYNCTFNVPNPFNLTIGSEVNLTLSEFWIIKRCHAHSNYFLLEIRIDNRLAPRKSSLCMSIYYTSPFFAWNDSLLMCFHPIRCSNYEFFSFTSSFIEDSLSKGVKHTYFAFEVGWCLSCLWILPHCPMPRWPGAMMCTTLSHCYAFIIYVVYFVRDFPSQIVVSSQVTNCWQWDKTTNWTLPNPRKK
jgi:hypothetical protein